MFEASGAFAFFDYFRVPYIVQPPEATHGSAATSMSLGRLRTLEQAEGSTRSLLWLPARIGQSMRAETCRIGHYHFGDCSLFGHVALDTAVPALLRGIGQQWEPIETLHNGDGQHTASIWQDLDGNVFLPFDPGEVMHYFWSEGYQRIGRSAVAANLRMVLLGGYYLVRPALPRPLQLRLRRGFTRVQSKSSFPGWPAEDSLHNLYSWLFALVAEIAGQPVPFIDLWPDGWSWALVLTHDVETSVGCRDIELLRGPERERGYKSSWNFVPLRYRVDDGIVRALQDQGCEVGVHGLRHDGRDLRSRRLLERRLPAMRAYARQWNATGFRSPGTQRHWELMPRLGFEYDSSYSDSDPYEPQPGGSCTYLPYFNENMVELPITLAQDHTLFMILDHDDASVWLRKAHHVRQRRGMALILTHPDYAHDARVADGYRALLDEFRGDESVWQALPRDVAAWWRQRALTSVCTDSGSWRLEGPASARGRVRVAKADGSYAELGAG
jgi:hypothetical protein